MKLAIIDQGEVFDVLDEDDDILDYDFGSIMARTVIIDQIVGAIDEALTKNYRTVIEDSVRGDD